MLIASKYEEIYAPEVSDLYVFSKSDLILDLNNTP